MWKLKQIFDGEYGCEERQPGEKEMTGADKGVRRPVGFSAHGSVAMPVIVGSAEHHNDAGIGVHFGKPSAKILVKFGLPRGNPLPGNSGAADAVIPGFRQTVFPLHHVHIALFRGSRAAAFRDAVP